MGPEPNLLLLISSFLIASFHTKIAVIYFQHMAVNRSSIMRAREFVQ